MSNHIAMTLPIGPPVLLGERRRVLLSFPANMTQTEARRLCRIILTLALDDPEVQP